MGVGSDCLLLRRSRLTKRSAYLYSRLKRWTMPPRTCLNSGSMSGCIYNVLDFLSKKRWF